MLVVTRKFITVFVLRLLFIGVYFRLIDLTEELALLLSLALEPFPTRLVQEVILLGIDGTCDGVGLGNDAEGLTSDLTVFPFDHDVDLAAFIVRMVTSHLLV